MSRGFWGERTAIVSKLKRSRSAFPLPSPNVDKGRDLVRGESQGDKKPEGDVSINAAMRLHEDDKQRF